MKTPSCKFGRLFPQNTRPWDKSCFSRGKKKTQQPKPKHTHTHTPTLKKGVLENEFHCRHSLVWRLVFFAFSQWEGCIALLGPRYPEFYETSCLFCEPSGLSPGLLLMGGPVFATQSMRLDSDILHPSICRLWCRYCWVVFGKPALPVCANTCKGFHANGRKGAGKTMPHLFYLVSVVKL